MPNTFKVKDIEISVEPWSWEFAIAHRDEIDQHFARLKKERPAIWNGRALLLNRYSIREGILRGNCFETEYASFIAWRDWGFPDDNVHNFFAAAALCSSDGAYLLGEMAPYTAGAHELYFPSGMVEASDIHSDGTLDLQANLRRELFEETGIDIDELDSEPGWTAVVDRSVVALMKNLTARHNADELRARIMRYLASEAQPELSDVYIVRGLSDLKVQMPHFLRAFFEHLWAL